MITTESDTMQVLLGNGDGTFTAHATYQDSSLGPVVLADLDGDGKLDVVTGDTRDDTLRVWLGHGDGTFGAAADYPTVGWPMDPTSP